MVKTQPFCSKYTRNQSIAQSFSEDLAHQARIRRIMSQKTFFSCCICKYFRIFCCGMAKNFGANSGFPIPLIRFSMPWSGAIHPNWATTSFAVKPQAANLKRCLTIRVTTVIARAVKARKARDFLVRVGPLRILFRNKFLAKLGHAYKSQQLIFPGLVETLADPNAFYALKNKVFGKVWVVYCKEPFSGSKQVLAYLGRDTHRVAISNSRILFIGFCSMFCQKGIGAFAYSGF
jgi:hypothetical protein